MKTDLLSSLKLLHIVRPKQKSLRHPCHTTAWDICTRTKRETSVSKP